MSLSGSIPFPFWQKIDILKKKQKIPKFVKSEYSQKEPHDSGRETFFDISRVFYSPCNYSKGIVCSFFIPEKDAL